MELAWHLPWLQALVILLLCGSLLPRGLAQPPPGSASPPPVPPPLPPLSTSTALEVAALLAFKNGIEKSSWPRSWAWSSASPCIYNLMPWPGVSCGFPDPAVSLEGRVVGLQIMSQKLRGNLSSSLCALTMLGMLNLSDNALRGTVPADCSRLSNLMHLDLSNNSLAGPVPPQYSALGGLRQLLLEGNALTGPVPPQYSALRNLTQLRLGGNALNGTLPPQYSSFTQLEYLGLDNNSLTSTLPPGWAIVKLQYLNLQFNQLNGTLPARWSQLTSVVGMDLDHNNFSGALTPWGPWSSLHQLLWLDLEHNQLMDPLPPANVPFPPSLNKAAAVLLDFKASCGTSWSENSIRGWSDRSVDPCPWIGIGCDTSKNVTSLALPGRRLSGSISPSLSFLTQLTRLTLAGNRFSGPLPPQYTTLTRLADIDLSFNQLNTTLPAQWSTLVALSSVSLASTSLAGSLPPGWANLSSLTSLNLSNNELTGSLPTLPSTMQSLSLRSNRLKGPLPAQWREQTNLQTLLLDSNALSGLLPSTWGNLTRLTTLGLSNNSLTGPLPPEWGAMGSPYPGFTSQGALNLSHNALTGALPAQWSGLSRLATLDLSTNSLNGTLPPQWSALASLVERFRLTHLDLADNHVSGALPPEWSALEGLSSLQLGGNRLDGPLPPQWSNLSSVTALDLHGNRLTGPLPAAWSRLTQLSSLDLRDNLLTGPLPPEWSALSHLTALHLELNSARWRSSELPPQWSELSGAVTLDSNVISDPWPFSHHDDSPHREPTPSQPLQPPSSPTLPPPPELSSAPPPPPPPPPAPDDSSSSSSSSSATGAIIGSVVGGVAALALAAALALYFRRRKAHAHTEAEKQRAQVLGPGDWLEPGDGKGLTTASTIGIVLAGADVELGGSPPGSVAPGSGAAKRSELEAPSTGASLASPLQQSELLEGSVDGSCSQQQVSCAHSPAVDAAHAANGPFAAVGPHTKMLEAYALAAAGVTSVADVSLPCVRGEPSTTQPTPPKVRWVDEQSTLMVKNAISAGGPGLTASNSSTKQIAPTRSVPTIRQRSDVQLELDWERDIVIYRDCKLGKGGQGQVMKGLYRGHEVAVKIINDDSASSLLDLQTELQFLARMDHENIVHVYGGCMSPPDLFVVQELMEGDLHSRIHKQEEALDLPAALHLLMDVTRGLAYLHALDIVHRDLKPGNILLDKQGQAKIADFGLARLKPNTYLSTKRPEAGTMIYSAPECFDDELGGLSTKADVYSLGIIIWEVITREMPWGHLEYPGQIIYQVTLKHNRPPLPQPSEHCPQALLDLISRTWDKQPSARPSAQQVYEGLEAILDGLSRPATATASCQVAASPAPLSVGRHAGGKGGGREVAERSEEAEVVGGRGGGRGEGG